MDVALLIAAAAVVVLIAELLLPTGGVLAALGALGLIAAGIVSIESGSGAADIVGPSLIALGIVSIVAFYFVTRKVLAAHRDEPVRTGSEELIGALGEARGTIDPTGQVFAGGTIWGARLAVGAGPARLGDRVRVDAVEGLTLIVRPEPTGTDKAEQGAS
jgi:membrane-bound serine protease (ClpP class)